jgi:hypothetical protein
LPAEFRSIRYKWPNIKGRDSTQATSSAILAELPSSKDIRYNFQSAPRGVLAFVGRRLLLVDAGNLPNKPAASIASDGPEPYADFESKRKNKPTGRDLKGGLDYINEAK